MDEYGNRRPHRFLGVLLVVGLVLLALYLIRNKELVKSKLSSLTKDENQEVVEGQPSVVTQDEWETMKSTVDGLRNEVEQLKQEVQQLKNSQPALSPKQTPTTTVIPNPSAAQQPATNTTASQQSSESFNSDAVTLANYTHDYINFNASVSLKNNTSHPISQVAGRMIYYDMNGNMLDYYDFKKAVNIDAGMVKNMELPGYGHNDHYAYYKSELFPLDRNRKYKVSFELKSYK